MEILDCTLRDGGYYTNWDFPQDLVARYFEAVNSISDITHIEIGYRSLPVKEYFGEYFYCPIHVLQLAREKCPNKKIVVMLNEKDVRLVDLDMLLDPCAGLVDMVRLAVDPDNLSRASLLSSEIMTRGFEVGLNVMYMSKWLDDPIFMGKLADVKANFISMIDSYGGIYPQDIDNAIHEIKKVTSIPLGFHGHNNLELALANTIEAINKGCEMVDATITGMGRGAGNLKTELLLTYLDSKNLIDFKYGNLTSIVDEFMSIQKEYFWGTSLPYMISGAYSLPQKEVMSWIAKKRYTTESIINALQNHKKQQPASLGIQKFSIDKKVEKIVIVGGGINAKKHAHALKQFSHSNPETVIIHAGVRYISLFQELSNKQYVCLLGAEGYKMKPFLLAKNTVNYTFIIEPSPHLMGIIIPEGILAQTFELTEISLFDDFPDSLLTIAFQIADLLDAKDIFLFGLDGYDIKKDEQMLEVSQENQFLIDIFIRQRGEVKSLTPTTYRNIQQGSIYSMI